MFTNKKRSKNGKKNGLTDKKNPILPFLKVQSVRIWIAIVGISLILAFFLSPQILYFSEPHLKVGFIATRDIKADRDFLVEDRSSTEQKRVEALKDVLPIYDFDRDMPAIIGIELSKAFRDAESSYAMINAADWTGDRKSAINEIRSNFDVPLDIILTDREFKTLESKDFSFELCNIIVQLLYSVYNDGSISNKPFSAAEREKGITIRDIKTQNETEQTDLTAIMVLADAQELLSENAKTLLKDAGRDVRNLSVSIAQQLVRPNLTFANNATEQRKQETIESVKPVYYQVQKNEMIVREGEKITPAIQDKVSTFFQGREGRQFNNISIFAGMFLTILFLSGLLYVISGSWLKNTKDVYSNVLFLGFAAILQVLLVKAGIFIAEALGNAFTLFPAQVYFFAIPFTVGTMLISILIGRGAGLMFSVFLSFIIVFLFQERAAMFLYSLAGSLVAAHRIYHCSQRSAFFRTGLLVGVVNIVVILCLTLISGNTPDLDTPIKLLMGIVGGVLSAFIVSGIVPLCESLFGYTTDMRLLELANLNQPIFQRMIMVAPGTYHHSVVVASMAEAAAEAIGANSLLAKVSAYYHDIGKIRKPQYYIENQRKWENRHDRLSPEMSKLIIISHVKDGFEMAKELRLGKSIADIIRQHHGTRLVSYFYEKAKKEHKDPGNPIPESDFRYPGPRPQSREAAIVLVGDIIEAAARTLNDPTPSRIKNLVDTMIRQILVEGELDESELTFRDLDKIADSFTRILTGIFHQRIEYADSPVKNINGTKGGHGDIHNKRPEQDTTGPDKGTKIASGNP